MTDGIQIEQKPEEVERLGKHIQSYISNFNIGRTVLAAAAPPLPLFSDEIKSATALRSAEGWIVVYMTDWYPYERQPKHGVELQYTEHEQLSPLAQLLTGNNLKVSFSKAGDNIFAEPALPKDIPEVWGCTNKRLLKAFIDHGGSVVLNGIAVNPLWEFNNGLRTRLLPSRWRVYSPVIPVPPNDMPELQFLYPFIDLFWNVNELGLSEITGQEYANADIEVLLLGVSAGIAPQKLAEDPFEAVASHCEFVCDQLHELINKPETKEQAVQSFLEQPGNRFLISPHASNVVPQKSLAGLRYRIDFAVQRPDGDYHLVEIESPNTLIYQARGEEPTADFTHAKQQVDDWLRYVDEHRQTVRDCDYMPTINRPTGEVVIGRDIHMTDTARRRFDYARALNQRVVLKTYDMLIAEGRAYAASLRRMKSPCILHKG
jgi:hypothetical protein